MAETKQSIIEVIQTMVKNNEPEEKIIATLTSLGVEEAQAKRLLLIAEADTFNLLQTEIAKMTDTAVSKVMKDIKKESDQTVQAIINEKKVVMEKEVEKNFLTYTTSLSERQKAFQASVGDSITKLAQLNDEVYKSAEKNKQMITSIQAELTRAKMSGLKTQRSIGRYLIMIFGIVNLIAAFLILTSFFYTAFNIDYITIPLLLTLVGVALIYLSINI